MTEPRKHKYIIVRKGPEAPTHVPETIYLEPLCTADPWDGRRWSEEPFEGCGEPGCECASIRYVHEARPTQCPMRDEGWWCSLEKGHDGPCASHPQDFIAIPTVEELARVINPDAFREGDVGGLRKVGRWNAARLAERVLTYLQSTATKEVNSTTASEQVIEELCMELDFMIDSFGGQLLDIDYERVTATIANARQMYGEPK